MWRVADRVVGDVIADALEGNPGGVRALDAREIRDAVADDRAAPLSATFPLYDGRYTILRTKSENANSDAGSERACVEFLFVRRNFKSQKSFPRGDRQGLPG